VLRRLLTLLPIGGLLLGLVVVLPAPPAAAAGVGDPDHDCSVDPTHADCEEWIAEHGPIDDPSDPVCLHHGDYVPCRSPWPIGDKLGWWVGDVVVGRHGWSFVYRDGDAYRIDDPEHGTDAMHGCWAWLNERTGGETGIDSPGGDPDRDGGWYRLLCLGEQQYSDDLDRLDMPGFHHELQAWRRMSPGPAGDPVQAALNAHASLNIGDPVVVTSPPESGSVPLGMPVWLAVAEDESTWGRLYGSGCDGPLCVEIEAYVDRVEWRLGDGEVRECGREHNVPWRPDLDYLDPAGVCHYYYGAPSRDFDGGRYQVEVIAHWHTHWSAPSLGLSSGSTPLEHSYETTTSVRVDEIQVLVRR
jgi:hypothetical protein